ncbi:MAG: WbqC family protein [Muribaculaceae bacterium]|nr:WbqC family protein [Muribaculaceae bacterium]
MEVKSATVPYMATVSWYRAYLDTRLASAAASDDDAVLAANRLCISNGRELSRSVVAGAHGQQPVLLSVPVAGGAHTVKRGGEQRWSLSDHGRWQPMHLGALKAAYGNTPFYSHCIDRIAPIISRPLKGEPGDFARMTRDIHHQVLEILNIEYNLPALRTMIMERKEFAATIHTEYSTDVMEYFSLFDVIFHKGEASIFTLLPP